jgi:hypothetical protein
MKSATARSVPTSRAAAERASRYACIAAESGQSASAPRTAWFSGDWSSVADDAQTDSHLAMRYRSEAPRQLMWRGSGGVVPPTTALVSARPEAPCAPGGRIARSNLRRWPLSPWVTGQI